MPKPTQAPISSKPRAGWLTPEQQRVWRAYITGSQVLLDRLDRELRESHQLSLPEYEILVRLSESPQRSRRMAELATSLSHSRSRVTHTISRMERDGLVTRTACPTDGRGVVAVLTDKGEQQLVDAAPGHVDAVQAHFVGRADPEDFVAMGRVFSAVLERLGSQLDKELVEHG